MTGLPGHGSIASLALFNVEKGLPEDCRPRNRNEADPLDELGVLGRVLGDIRRRLKAGGPDVNPAALHAYRAGVLVEEERRLVAERIATWQRWHQAYWELCAAIDSQALEKSVPAKQDGSTPELDSTDDGRTEGR